MAKKEKKFKQNRKAWFRGFKNIIKIRYKRPKFIYLGDKPTTNSIVLSNHIGATVPIILENYAEFPLRMWGTHEMNSGFRKLYNYQTKIYYHQKKGWNIHLARLFCLIAAPFTSLFYRGSRFISTYPDARIKKTLYESLETLKNKENIVIFPEMSDDGYHDKLKGFHAGFVLLSEFLLKNGIDVKIYASYYRRKDKVHIFEKPILYSDLKKIAISMDDMAKYLLDKTNALGKLDLKTITLP